jgi:hypothetical protein
MLAFLKAGISIMDKKRNYARRGRSKLKASAHKENVKKDDFTNSKM